MAGDARFLLRDKRQAPACPELITRELVNDLGIVDAVVAHADFDGCVAAAKFLRGGEPPYPEADEDARAIDAPGHGFACLIRGERLALALYRAQATRSFRKQSRLLLAIGDALVTGHEPGELSDELDQLSDERRRRLKELEVIVEQAEQAHADVLVLRAPPAISTTDRIALLRMLELRAKVAIVVESHRVTAATFHDDDFDLASLAGLNGGRGFAWGQTGLTELIPEIVELCEGQR